MNKIITKRDVTFFIVGLLTMLLIEFIFDWGNHVKAFRKGYNDAAKPTTQTEINK
jgi:hypothetical protein